VAAIDKQISNPYSTGGGGHNFELNIQASFVALMLTGGFVPCLPSCSINKIKLQAKCYDYETDDFVVFASDSNNEERKILCQVKHSISITEKNVIFKEVIQAAWKDFSNTKVFNRKKDFIALITGLLSADNLNDVRQILEWARHSEDSNEFINKVDIAKFSSQTKRDKLKAFRTNLTKANPICQHSCRIL
jgi:hypothetical protein